MVWKILIFGLEVSLKEWFVAHTLATASSPPPRERIIASRCKQIFTDLTGEYLGEFATVGLVASIYLFVGKNRARKSPETIPLRQ